MYRFSTVTSFCVFMYVSVFVILNASQSITQQSYSINALSHPHFSSFCQTTRFLLRNSFSLHSVHHLFLNLHRALRFAFYITLMPRQLLSLLVHRMFSIAPVRSCSILCQLYRTPCCCSYHHLYRHGVPSTLVFVPLSIR